MNNREWFRRIDREAVKRGNRRLEGETELPWSWAVAAVGIALLLVIFHW